MSKNEKTIFMPKALWKKWDTALRSRKYKQATGYLEGKIGEDRNGNAIVGHCCLGVLQMCIDGQVERDKYSAKQLPTKEWLDSKGIKFIDLQDRVQSCDPTLIVSKNINTYEPASELNDNGNHKFNEIADLIKNRVEFTDTKSAKKKKA